MKLLKYLISGGSGAVVNIGSFAILVHLLGVWYVAASVIAFLLSFAVSFTLQRFWTFDHRTREGIGRHATLYLGVALGNLALNTFIVYILVDKFSVWPIAAQLAGGVAIAATSYVVYNRYVFAQPA